ncbi:MAG: hypothetical protein V3V06_01375 [Dehalococcoidia bacterium]
MSESPFRRRRPRRVGAQSPFSGRGAARPPAGGEPGEEERRGRDRGPWIIGAAVVGLAILILILFVPPIALLDDDAESGEAAVAAAVEAVAGTGVLATLRDRIPDVPDNLRPVSPIYDLTVPANVPGPYVVTVRLNGPTQDQRNLGAYTHQDGLWRRLNPAIITDDGAAARVELDTAPSNIAILRRLQFRDMVTGRLPQGEELAAEAVNTLTIINPVGFVPAEDGSLLGRVEPIPAGVTQPIYPVIFAEEPETEIINSLIASETLRSQHINNILLLMDIGRFDGVDIDYQVVSPALRDAFSAFITELADQLHRDGRGIMVTVPLPRRDASGLNEGAYDLAALGTVVDRIKLAPPRDPSIFRESLVAALPAVLDRVAAEKLLLTVSPLSVVKSSGGLQTLTQRDALGLASLINVREPGPLLAGQRVTLVGDSIYQDGGASGLHWDQIANMVSFAYRDRNGDTVTVWIENRFSMAFKLNLVQEFKLGGLALDNVSADPAQADVWSVINDFLESGAVRLVLPNANLLLPVWEAETGELSGSGIAGWVVWTTPPLPGTYEVRLIVSDGDVRVGRALDVTVEP